jgi:triphosphatase
MAYNAADDESPEALTLTARDPLLRLAREVLAQEFAALRQHLRADQSAPGADAIHQMRIAIRRIRVALRLFENFLPERTRHFRHEFRWIGRALGQVRDLDVYWQGLAGADDSLPPAAVPLEHRIAQARANARAALAAQLAAPRFALLLSDFDDFVHRALTPGTLRRWQSLRIDAAARSDLRKSLARVLALGRKIDSESTPQQLHRLRIRAKRLRYESEFYADLRPSAQKLARGAKALQDILGTYRDACHAVDLLRRDRAEFELGQDQMCAATIGELIDAQCGHAAAARRAFAAAWRRFETRAAKHDHAKKRR